MDYVYMLRCGEGKGSYYTGWTNHLHARVKAHKSGRGAKYTKSHQPVELLYAERYADKGEALRREYAIKQLTRKEKEELMAEQTKSSHIYYLMGKSASGKDSIYQKLLQMEELQLRPLVLYTTRPIREGETDGVEYHFVDDTYLAEKDAAGKIIELREYQTVAGPWKYATVDDGSFAGEGDILGIGTPESYKKLKEYFGEEKMVPLYIEVEDGLRLHRALERERSQKTPRYAELCRRFLADAEDFAPEKLQEAGITQHFENTGKLEDCIEQIADQILMVRLGKRS